MMDPKSVQMACMADLGRQRQEELPLSDREGKRPSYEPSRRNGVGHLSPALKKDLENKWNVDIQDEESEQMRGLGVADPRPWATKFAQSYMRDHYVDAAPPIFQQQFRGPKRHKTGAKANLQNTDISKLGALIPPGGHPTTVPLQQTTLSKGPTEGITTTRPEKRSSADASSLTSQEHYLPRPASEVTRVLKPKATPLNSADVSVPPTQQTTSEHVVHKGECKVLISPMKAYQFIASFAMILRTDTNKAYLGLTAFEETKRFNVLEVEVVTGPHYRCFLTANRMGGDAPYTLQFSNSKEVSVFVLFLQKLQKAAASQVDARSNGSRTAPPSTQLAKSTPALTFSAPSHTESSVQSQGLAAAGTPSAAVPAQTPKKGIKSDGTLKLIDVESPPHPDELRAIPSIDDAADRLVDLIEKILPEAAKAGLCASNDVISDIRDAAIDEWLSRGFLGCETADMRSELLNLLRILVRIKQKAQSSKKMRELSKEMGQTSPAVWSLRDLEPDEKSHRITYTAFEMKKFGDKYSSNALRYGPIAAPHQPRPNRLCLAEDAIKGISKHLFWLDGKPELPLRSPSSSLKEQSKAREVVAGTKSEFDISPPKTTSASTGLTSSRWAR